MIRLSLCTLAIISLAPFGCPPTEAPVDDTLRDTITTTAEALYPGTAQPVQYAPVGLTVELVATATTATDGGAIYYAWLQTGGRGVAITDANLPTASFVTPSLETDQTLVFMVTARNDAGATGHAEVHVVITADPDYSPYDFGDLPGGGTTDTGPIARAGDNQSVLPNDEVTLDGSDSSGRDLTYQWRQISGPTVTLTNASTAQATFTAPAYDAEGSNDLRFELAVTDRDSRTVTDRVTVHVRDPDASDREVLVSTTMGEFTITLEPDEAPVTVENFLQYVDDGFYDGTIFHRVIPDFVVQGGGFTPGLNKKTTRDPIVNESDNGLSNIRTSVAMARLTDPDTATSQFYINVVDNTDLDYDESTDSPGYTVFGYVTDGMEVLDRIAAVETGTQSGFNDVPVTDVIVNSITRVSTGTNNQ